MGAGAQCRRTGRKRKVGGGGARKGIRGWGLFWVRKGNKEGKGTEKGALGEYKVKKPGKKGE